MDFPFLSDPEFRRQFLEACKRPKDDRPPAKPARPRFSARVVRMVKNAGKGKSPPEDYQRAHGETWNRFHGLAEFKIKHKHHSFHLGYYTDDPELRKIRPDLKPRVEGMLRYDRWAWRIWGEKARRKLNFPDHEQLRSIIVDGIPADPRPSGAGGMEEKSDES